MVNGTSREEKCPYSKGSECQSENRVKNKRTKCKGCILISSPDGSSARLLSWLPRYSSSDNAHLMEKRGIFLENFSTYDFVSALRASLCSLKSCINKKEVFLRRWLCWYRVSMQNGSRFFWKKIGEKSIWSRQRLIWPIWLPEILSR